LEHALQTLLPVFFSSDPQNAEKLGSTGSGSDTTNFSASSQAAEPASASLQEATKQAKVKLGPQR
jgi:autophagy-related protein 5